MVKQFYTSFQEIDEREDKVAEEAVKIPEDQYWASLESEKMPEVLMGKRKSFLDFFRGTELYGRICRSYRYYHDNYYSSDLTGDAVKVAGEEGEIRRISINQYRSAIKLLVSYITAQKPEWNAIAKTSDFEAIEGAKVTNNALDGYMDDPLYCLEAALGRAVEQSMVLTMGYLWDYWDPNAGEMLDAEEVIGVEAPALEPEDAETEEGGFEEEVEAGPPEEPEPLKLGDDRFEGEFDFRNPSIVDVIYDLSAESFEKSSWVLVRALENKYDLAAVYPDHRAAILGAREASDEASETKDEITDPLENLAYFGLETQRLARADSVWVYYFYHRPRPSLRGGRFIRFVGETVLEERKCRSIPVSRMLASEYMLTSFGYSQCLDAQGGQEALNAIASALLTNQSALGSNKMWFRSGETINQADLEPGVSVIQTLTKPESLNFLQSSPELPMAVNMYTQFIDTVLGLSGVSRGQIPPAARSAASLAMLDSRTLQQASDIIKNYRLFLCRVGSSMARTLGEWASEARMVMMMGEYGARYVGSFTKETLRHVKRVIVQSGNPMTSTLAGRVQMAEFLIQNGLIKTPEEMITVLKTGNLDRLTEHVEATVRSAQAENDAVLRGEEIDTFLLTDDHAYHAKKIVSILDMPAVRRDPAIRTRVQAHAMQHAQALTDPVVQQFQILMGYQLAGAGPARPQGGSPPKPSGGTGMPGGANPEVAQRVAQAEAAASLG